MISLSKSDRIAVVLFSSAGLALSVAFGDSSPKVGAIGISVSFIRIEQSFS